MKKTTTKTKKVDAEEQRHREWVRRTNAREKEEEENYINPEEGHYILDDLKRDFTRAVERRPEAAAELTRLAGTVDAIKPKLLKRYDRAGEHGWVTNQTMKELLAKVGVSFHPTDASAVVEKYIRIAYDKDDDDSV